MTSIISPRGRSCVNRSVTIIRIMIVVRSSSSISSSSGMDTIIIIILLSVNVRALFVSMLLLFIPP